MTTREAIQAMLDGKKVRAKNWGEGYYVHFSDHAGFLDESLALINITPEDDWEIYEEPKLKKTVTIEKWLLEGKVLTQKERYLHIVETSNIDRYIKTWADYKKVKLLDTYEVEL